MSVDGSPVVVQRPTRGPVVVSLVVAAVVGTGMLMVGRTLDPWTAGLAAPLTVAAVTLARGGRRATCGPRASLHGETDAATGVGNTRAALTTVDRELERARSYESVFSVAVVEIDHAAFSGLHPRRTHRVLADLLGGVARDVRLGDRVCRVQASDRELILVVLPDTGGQGARTFVDRLLGQVRRQLLAEDLLLDDHVRAEVMTHPDDLDLIQRLQRRLEVLDGADALIRDVSVRRLRSRRSAEDIRMTLPEDAEAAAPRD